MGFPPSNIRGAKERLAAFDGRRPGSFIPDLAVGRIHQPTVWNPALSRRRSFLPGASSVCAGESMGAASGGGATRRIQRMRGRFPLGWAKPRARFGKQSLLLLQRLAISPSPPVPACRPGASTSSAFDTLRRRYF